MTHTIFMPFEKVLQHFKGLILYFFGARIKINLLLQCYFNISHLSLQKSSKASQNNKSWRSILTAIIGFRSTSVHFEHNNVGRRVVLRFRPMPAILFNSPLYRHLQIIARRVLPFNIKYTHINQ